MFRNFIQKILKSESFRKILYTLIIVAIYKTISYIPLPFLNLEVLYQNVEKTTDLFNMFLGGGVERFGLLSLGIMPYITSTILTQILSSSSLGTDFFRVLKGDQNTGVTQLNKWTKYLTILIATVHGTYAIWNMSMMKVSGLYLVPDYTYLFYIVGIPITIAGSLVAVWLSNLISKNGIGSGSNVIIFTNIVSEAFGSVVNIVKSVYNNELSLYYFGILVFFIVCICVVIIFVDNSFYKIRIQGLGHEYVNRDQYLKLKLNNAGIMPVIIASYLSHIPQLLEMLIRSVGILSNQFSYFLSFVSHNTTGYFIFITVLIIFATLNYSEISLDTKDISKQLQENNIVVLESGRNIRPGKSTEMYIKEIVSNIPSALIVVAVFIGSQIFSILLNNSVGAVVITLSGTSIMLAISTARSIFSTIFSHDYASVLQKYKSTDVQNVEKQIEESYV